MQQIKIRRKKRKKKRRQKGEKMLRLWSQRFQLEFCVSSY